MYEKTYRLLFGIFAAIGVGMIAIGGILCIILGTEAGQLKDSNGMDTGLYISRFLLFLLGGIGLVFLLIGVIGLGVRRSKEKMKKRLKETGKSLYAEILTVEQNYNIMINGRCPYQIIAQYIDASTKTIYQYKSEYIREYPAYAKAGESVRIYLDRNNTKKYYMDLSSIYKSFEY